MKKLFVILSIFIMPLRVRSARLPLETLKSRTLPYR